MHDKNTIRNRNPTVRVTTSTKQLVSERIYAQN